MELKNWKLFLLVMLLSIECFAQQTIAPFKTQQANTLFYVNMGNTTLTTIQKTVTAACAYSTATLVDILPGANPSDTIGGLTSACTNTAIYDQRSTPAANYTCSSGGCTLVPYATAGTAGGDLSGTYPNPTVARVNGAVVPASQTALASNSSRQVIAASLEGVGTKLLTYTGTEAAGNMLGTDGNGTAIDSGIDPGDIVTDIGNNVYSGTNNYLASTFFGTITQATSGANHNSAFATFLATYWNGSVSANDQWNWQNVMGSGTNPTSTLTLGHTGSSGAAAVALPALQLANLTPGDVPVAGAGGLLGNGPALSNLPLLNATNTFSAVNTFSSEMDISSAATTGLFTTPSLMSGKLSGTTFFSLAPQTGAATFGSTSGGQFGINPTGLIDGANGSGVQQWSISNVNGSSQWGPTTGSSFNIAAGGANINGQNNSVLQWQITNSTGAAAFKSLSATSTIVNGAGMQVATSASQPACAAGTTCGVTITLPVAEPDTAYLVIGCSIINLSAGTPFVENVAPTATTFLGLQVFNTAGVATSTYNVQCLVLHI